MAAAGGARPGARTRAGASRPAASWRTATSRRPARRIRASCSTGGAWRAAGIGAWPQADACRCRRMPSAAAARWPAIGYPGPAQGVAVRRSHCVAFQRRYRPSRLRRPSRRRDHGPARRRRRLVRGRPRRLPSARCRRPDGRSRREAGEESPGSTGTRCRVTPGGGDPRESATESRPPAGARLRPRLRARVKGCGKSAPRRRQRRWHGKPHREQDQVGTTAPAPARVRRRPVSGPVVRVGRARLVATRVPEEWPSPGPRAGDRTRLTGRLRPLLHRAADAGTKTEHCSRHCAVRQHVLDTAATYPQNCA